MAPIQVAVYLYTNADILYVSHQLPSGTTLAQTNPLLVILLAQLRSTRMAPSMGRLHSGSPLSRTMSGLRRTPVQ
jgi:hypothetical protein